MPSTTHLDQCPALSGLDFYLRPLSIADVKSCVIVESAFPEQERCSEEKFTYRLTQSPTLSLGLFLKEPSNDRLIGHVIGNRTSSPVITDGSMLMPENWRSLPAGKPLTSGGQLIGNDPNGKTIAVHSVVMTPEFQRGGIGRALVKDYVKYVRENMDGERAALIAHDHLVGFYESAGFENLGISEVRFAGGGWYDMVLPVGLRV